MGNQMFQYAFARALAERNHDRVVLDAAPLLDRTPRSNFVFRGYDLDLYTIDARLTLFSRAALRFPVPVLWAGLSVVVTFVKQIFGVQKFVRESDDFTPASIDSIPRRGNLYLDGAWQGEDFFASVAPIIRREFTLREPLSARAQELTAEMQAPGRDAICVNVRRGDFVTVQRSMEQHGFVGLEYYRNSMKNILIRLGSSAHAAHVYIFSDEIDWCREHLQFPEFPEVSITYVGPEYAGKKFGEYLMLLAAGKHFIIPNSSFAWWGAWLGTAPDKIVIAPNPWDRIVTERSQNIVPAGWIRLENN
jgi:hypothetical protein